MSLCFKHSSKAVKLSLVIMDDSSSDSDCPIDVEAAAEAALAGILPEKSKALYEASYKRFDTWREKNKIKTVDEKCMLAYFSQELASMKPSTKWSRFSMLKTTINLNNGINIASYMNLVSFLKRKSDGYRPKKSKIFTNEQIFRFLKEADDEIYLANKVALIVGVYGACRREEILKLTLEDIEDIEDCVKITIPNTKTKIQRQFLITKGNAPDVDMVKIFRSYAKKRPSGVSHSRFFVGYRSGKCIKQPMGINMVGNIPRKVAEYLKLPEPQQYTGHCFRRSSASLLADAGADISVLKRHGGWKSSTVAEGYVENSVQQKKGIAHKIFGTSHESSSNSKETETIAPESSVRPSTSKAALMPEFNFPVPPSATCAPTTSSTPNPVQINNLTNCTINFYQNR